MKIRKRRKLLVYPVVIHGRVLWIVDELLPAGTVLGGLRHECKKRGVDLLFAKTPELDGIAGVILPAVLHAMDEVHSMLSREKGLAGMAENVRRGHRAGGRAGRSARAVISSRPRPRAARLPARADPDRRRARRRRSPAT